MTGWKALLDQLLRALPEPAIITDLQGSIELVNDSMLQLVDLDQDKAIGHPFRYPCLLSQEQMDRLLWVNHGSRSEDAMQVEGLVTDSEGNRRVVNFSTTALLGPDGRTQWLLSIGRDATPQKTGQELHRDLESELNWVVEDMPVWVQLSQPDGTIEVVNEAACAIFGYDLSELIGQTWPYPWFLTDWTGKGDDPLVELLRTGEVRASEVTCVTFQGERKVLNVTMSLVCPETDQPRRVLMVSQDITERKRWEDGLMQSEKLRVVSQLASGMAHDINNDLAVIFGYSEYLLS